MSLKLERKEFITAVKWTYGYTTREASELWKQRLQDGNYIKETIALFERNAKKSFYQD